MTISVFMNFINLSKVQKLQNSINNFIFLVLWMMSSFINEPTKFNTKLSFTFNLSSLISLTNHFTFNTKLQINQLAKKDISKKNTKI